MDDAYLAEKLYSYLFYAAAVLALLSGIFSYNPYLILACALLLLVSAVYLHSGKAVNTFLLRHRLVIEIVNSFRLSRDGMALVKRHEGSYYGMAIARLGIRETTNKSADAIASILDSIRMPFKYSVDVKEADSEKILDNLTARRRIKEIRLSRIDSKSYDKRRSLEREIEVLSKEIAEIRTSGKALELSIKLQTSCLESSEAGAASEALRSLNSICTIFSTTLGLDYEILSGERLLSAAV